MNKTYTLGYAYPNSIFAIKATVLGRTRFCGGTFWLDVPGNGMQLFSGLASALQTVAEFAGEGYSPTQYCITVYDDGKELERYKEKEKREMEKYIATT